ncbi:MAG: WecB/TagA/CpsF family glycosyltransferase [Clostridia bacterium]|nr:WecB/TagA/CpsF family glycosyltransferase [Clostridia bacterium]
MFDTVRILSLDFPLTPRRELLLTAHRLIGSKRAARIYTPNAEMAYRAARDPAFSALLHRADLLLPDGVGISMAAARQGVSLSRVSGIDFAEALLRTAPRPYRVFLLGAKPGIGAAAARELSRRYARAEIVGVQDGYFPCERSHTVAAAIAGMRPDLLFVCLGSPRQEQWIDTHAIPCLAMGLGGSLDVWAGEVKRAPAVMQRAGLEWLWRTARDPRRLARLPALAGFAWRALTEKVEDFSVNCEKTEP